MSEELNKPGIYFRKGKKHIKIGFGKSILERLDGATTDADDGEIYIVGHILTDDYEREEKLAHNFFDEFRRKGEWFDITLDQVKSYIEYRKGSFFREAKILEARTQTIVSTLWGTLNVSTLRPRCAWYPEHQAAIKDKASGNSNKSETYQTIPVVRDTVFNEKHPSFSHIGKNGVYRFFASGKKYKEWNDEKRYIRNKPKVVVM